MTETSADVRELLQGRLVRRLLALFLLLALVPIVAFTTIPTLYQLRANERVVEEASTQLRQQAEADLRQMARVHARHYDLIFQQNARTALWLADAAAAAVRQPAVSEACCGLAESALVDGPANWRAYPAEASYGLLVSPLAVLDSPTLARQNSLFAVMPRLHGVVDNDPHVRSAFVLTEDQTLWLYPNDFWDGGALQIHSGPDLSERPYYRETTEIVFSDPYVDKEPVVTIAAPIWVEGAFLGMAGIDFSLEVFTNEILETEIGERGFFFLIGNEGQLIAFSDRAANLLLLPDIENEPLTLIGHTLFDSAPAAVQEQLGQIDLRRTLRTDNIDTLVTIDLPGGAAYFAIARMPQVPWHVVVVQPVDDVTRVATTVAENLPATTRSMYTQALISGVGFLIVVLIGGLITLRRLAIPVQELARGTNRLHEGHLDYRVPVSQSDDEIAALGRNFNIMAESLQKMHDNLDRERNKLEEALVSREEEFAVVNEIAALANREADLPSNLARALEIVRDAMGTDILLLSLLGDDGELSYTAFACAPEIRECVLGHCATHADEPLLRQAIGTREVVYIPNPDEMANCLSEEQRHCYRQLNVQQLAVQPIASKGHILGALMLMRHQVTAIPQQKISFLQEITSLLGLLIENANLQNQRRELSIMHERRRLARELHDSVTQSLFTLRLMAQGLKAALPQADEPQQEALDILIAQVQAVQQDMRLLISELRPVDLQNQALGDEIRRHARSLKRAAQVEVTLSITGDTRTLPHAIQRHLNRIAQEALSNVARHATASHVELQLQIKPEQVRLSIVDDGDGFDVQAVASGTSGSLGLLNMRERAEMMGATLNLRSTPESGTCVSVIVPLKMNRG